VGVFSEHSVECHKSYWFYRLLSGRTATSCLVALYIGLNIRTELN